MISVILAILKIIGIVLVCLLGLLLLIILAVLLEPVRYQAAGSAAERADRTRPPEQANRNHKKSCQKPRFPNHRMTERQAPS